jgi:phospholipase C
MAPTARWCRTRWPRTWIAPNPDTGEEYPHTNIQLYGILSEANRFKLGAEISAPYNAPAPGQAPTMDGFVPDYISTLTAELSRQPTYEEYSQVMTGTAPDPGSRRILTWIK